MAAAESIPRQKWRRRIAPSRAPCAWATSPVVAMRKKPKVQKIPLKKIPPMATPPSAAAPGRWPDNTVSTVESSGWVRLERMSGIASRKTRRYQVAIDEIVRGGDAAFSFEVSANDWER